MTNVDIPQTKSKLSQGDHIKIYLSDILSETTTHIRGEQCYLVPS